MKDNISPKNGNELNSSLTKRQRKILRIKKVILDGASDLFSNNIYENISMIDIADHVALSRATLYNYFKSKEDIFFEIGIRKIKDIVKEQKILLKNTKSGLKGVLSIFNRVGNSLLELPFHHKVIERFFLKLDEMNFLDKYVNNLLSGNYFTEKELKLESYEEHIKNMIITYSSYQRMLNSELMRGKEDGSIKCSLNDYELYSLTNLIYFGFGDLINIKLFRKNKEEILNITLNLLEKILTDKTK
jgi:AcrR family transcriptional regulator